MVWVPAFFFRMGLLGFRPLFKAGFQPLRLRTAKFKAAEGFMLGAGKKGSWFRVKRVVDRANIVLEVLDSRDPLGTRSLELERLVRRRGKNLLLALNKADLIPESILNEWIDFFRSKGYRVFPLSARRRRTLLPLEEY